MAQRFAQYFNPVLTALKELDGSARPREVYDRVSEDMKLDDSVRDETNKSGVRRFENDIAWARSYLVKTGHIDKSLRGVWALTEKGRHSGILSDQDVCKIIQSVQKQICNESVATQIGDSHECADELDSPPVEDEQPPHRQLLLEFMGALPPSGFERLCQRLLRESGFENVTVTGKSGDGGIDGVGVLKINPFVTLKVLFQCKRWKGTVGSSQVRDFRGAMTGRTDKGMILTTGTLSTEAHREAVREGAPAIELIGGEELVELFEQLELGLTPRKTFDIDEEFFKEFQE